MAQAKHILIGGGSGFIGTELAHQLRKRGDKVTLISRTAGPGRMTWDDIKENGIPRADVVVNLAGKHILDMRQRWTEAYKEEVLQSRLDTTQILIDAMHQTPPELFISTVGKCFYGTQELDSTETYPELNEYSTPMGKDYPSELVGQWERAASQINGNLIRHVQLRLGIVLAANRSGKHHVMPWKLNFSRGIFPIMMAPFLMGLGARFGHGAQPFPWVHIDDVVNLMLKAIDDRAMQGCYNAVSPGIVDNDEFTRALAKKIRRPRFLRVPRWLIRSIVGDERASILLQGQRVIPKRTMAAGFHFRFSDLDAALDHLTGQKISGEVA